MIFRCGKSYFDGLQYLVFGNYVDPSDTLPAGVGGTKAGVLRYLFIAIFKIYPWFATVLGGFFWLVCYSKCFQRNQE